MRKIKFRGINVLTKKWEYGHLFKGLPTKIDDTFIVTTKCESIAHFTAVFESSVGQWTGLYDKNGKEILYDFIRRKKRNNKRTRRANFVASIPDKSPKRKSGYVKNRFCKQC